MQPELNGAHGTLLKYHAAKQRWAVQLSGVKEATLFREQNLTEPCSLSAVAAAATASISALGAQEKPEEGCRQS